MNREEKRLYQKEYSRKWREKNPDHYKNYYREKKDNPDLFSKREKDPIYGKWTDNPNYHKEYPKRREAIRLEKLKRSVALAKRERLAREKKELEQRRERQKAYLKEWRRKNPDYWKEYFKENPNQLEARKRRKRLSARRRQKRIYYEGYINPIGELQWLRTAKARLLKVKRHLVTLEACQLPTEG